MWAAFAKEYGISRWEMAASLAVAAAAGAASAQLSNSMMIAAMTALLAWAMALITFVDRRQFTIPDALSLPTIPLGILASAVAPGVVNAISTAQDSLVAAIVGAGVLFTVRYVYLRYRGVEGLGLGDVKLAASAGAWVGLDWLAATCLLATCAALLAVLLRGLLGKPAETTLQTAVPFGSFIAPSAVLVWLWRLAS